MLLRLKILYRRKAEAKERQRRFDAYYIENLDVHYTCISICIYSFGVVKCGLSALSKIRQSEAIQKDDSSILYNRI